MSTTKRVPLLIGLAVPLAELGHVLAYGLRVSNTGAHAYFPSAFHAAGALIGALLLAALGVLVLGRLLGGRTKRRPAWSFTLLFLGLLLSQLLVYLLQEGLEAGRAPGHATVVLGLVAQQPVALLAALALHWLSARLGPAIEALSSSTSELTFLETAWLLHAAISPAAGCRPALAYSVPGSRAPPA
jgi:hypothetical protein